MNGSVCAIKVASLSVCDFENVMKYYQSYN
jgi:hypothetical protein